MSKTTATIVKLHDLFGENLLNFEDGARVHKLVHDELVARRAVVLDFSGVRIVASAFLNAAVGQLYADVPSDVIKKHLTAENASDIALFALKRVVENSKRYYSDHQYRDAVDSSVSALLEA